MGASTVAPVDGDERDGPAQSDAARAAAVRAERGNLRARATYNNLSRRNGMVDAAPGATPSRRKAWRRSGRRRAESPLRAAPAGASRDGRIRRERRDVDDAAAGPAPAGLEQEFAGPARRRGAAPVARAWSTAAPASDREARAARGSGRLPRYSATTWRHAGVVPVVDPKTDRSVLFTGRGAGRIAIDGGATGSAAASHEALRGGTRRGYLFVSARPRPPRPRHGPGRRPGCLVLNGRRFRGGS